MKCAAGNEGKFWDAAAATQHASAGGDAAIAARIVRPLLQQLIGELHRVRGTSLLFQVDSPSIVTATWNAQWPLLDEDERRIVSDGQRLCQTLDELLLQACRDECDEQRAGVSEPPNEDGRLTMATGKLQDMHHPLAALARWFDELSEALHAASDASVAALALRLEGYDVRDVALRLGLGVRLVLGLLAEVRRRLNTLASSR